MSQVLTNEFYSSTFLIGLGDYQGTGFATIIDNKQYLVSAKHVFDSIDLTNEQKLDIDIRHEGVWKKLKATVYLHHNDNIDLIVFKITGFFKPHYQHNLSIGGLQVGQDMFFLGFPFGMFTDQNEEINGRFPFPFVKKALCSAIDFNTHEGTLMYLDGHTNRGFSGGPLIFKDLQCKEFKVAGIILEYIKQEGKIPIQEVDYDGNVEDDELSYDENSGIIRAVSITHVREIIDNIQ